MSSEAPAGKVAQLPAARHKPRAGYAVGTVADGQRSVVSSDDGPGDGQAQAAMRAEVLVGRTDRMEPFEHRLALVQRDAGSIVADR